MSTHNHKSIEELEKIAPGVVNMMTDIVLFEHKNAETFRKLNENTSAFLEKHLKERCRVHVPLETQNDPSSNFECYIERYYTNGTVSTYKFAIDSLTL
jgi:hypothetical protein